MQNFPFLFIINIIIIIFIIIILKFIIQYNK